MSTDYYCSNSIKCLTHENEDECEASDPGSCEYACDYSYTATYSNCYQEPGFTGCPRCKDGVIMKYGKPHVPKEKKLADEVEKAIDDIVRDKTAGALQRLSRALDEYRGNNRSHP